MNKLGKIMVSVFSVMLICASVALANPNLYQINDQQVSAEFIDGKYPVVNTKNLLVKSRVNGQINKIINEYEQKIQQDNAQGHQATGYINYQLKANNGEILSMIIDCSTMYKGAAHPNTYTFGLTFDKEGNLIQLSQLINESYQHSDKDYSVEHLNQEIKKQVGQNLYPFFTDVKAFPSEFYIDDNLNLHVLFQRYDIAPYSAGLIDIILP